MCRDPLLAAERARKREELLAATEKRLAGIVRATQRKRRPLCGAQQISLAVGKVIDRHNLAKHLELSLTDTSLGVRRKHDSIAREAALDGLTVIRSSVSAELFSAGETVGAYKDLSHVERALRSLKTVHLQVRPIFQRKARRLRGHVFVCLLAYSVEWHRRARLAPMLFDDDDRPAAEAARESIVAPAQRSAKAIAKAATQKTADGLPVHSFQTLLRDLATLTLNTVSTPLNDKYSFQMATQPTAIQAKAFELLDVKPQM